jgi:CheY-like chemotaxis protein
MLRDKGVAARFIVLTVSDSKRDVAAAIRSGAHGYLLKDMDPEELFDALAPDPQRPFFCVPPRLLDDAPHTLRQRDSTLRSNVMRDSATNNRLRACHSLSLHQAG